MSHKGFYTFHVLALIFLSQFTSHSQSFYLGAGGSQAGFYSFDTEDIVCNCQMEHLSVSEFSGQFLTHTPESSLIAYKDFALHEVNPNNGLGIIYFDFDPNVFPQNLAGIASVGGGIFYMIGGCSSNSDMLW